MGRHQIFEKCTDHCVHDMKVLQKNRYSCTKKEGKFDGFFFQKLKKVINFFFQSNKSSFQLSARYIKVFNFNMKYVQHEMLTRKIA